jgi:nucleolar complex protein 3
LGIIYFAEYSTGEALNLDLHDFTVHLYKIIPYLAIYSALEKDYSTKASPNTVVDLLFRALNTILMPKFTKAPSYLLAAFSKRLVNLSMHTNPDTTLRILEFIKNLLSSDTKLEALLSTEERIANGIYRDDVNDPQLCNPFAAVWWEVLVLEELHYDERVRQSAHVLRTRKSA